jgi:hypothetical protein
MCYALEHDSEMKEIAWRGKFYADNHFSPQAVETNLKNIISACVLKTISE